MPFGRQVYAATAQVLGALSNDAAQTLLYKHLGVGNLDPGMMGFVAVITGSPDAQVAALISEVVGQENQLRHNAPTRHVFDSRVRDLTQWLFHDGWAVEDGRLVTIAPAVEETTGLRDQLIEELAASGLDADGALRQALDEAATAFRSTPPDFNEATVKVRLVLETAGRRGATAIAARRGMAYPQDSWGRAIALFRTAGVIDAQEEDLLTRTYTLISPGAHVPVGISAEEWARLARTYALSAAYFLIRKYRTAA